MSLRGLLVLLLALAVAVAIAIVVKPPKPKPAEEGGPLVAPFEEAKLSAIAIACGGPVALERAAGGGWRLVGPNPAEADPRAVHTVVTALQDARVRKVIAEAGASGAAFGLDPSPCTATLTIAGEAKPRVVKLGRTSPVGTERYALDPKGRVVFADGSLESALAKPAADFRERRLVPVEPETITAIVLDRPDGRLAVERAGAGWRLTAPVTDVAGDTACTDLARAVATMEVDEPRSDLEPRDVRPERRIAVRVTVSGGTQPKEAFVAASGADGKRLAWREGGGVAGLVPEARVEELTRDAGAYRDRHPASFSAPDVLDLAITRGSATLRVSRAADGSPWTVREGDGPSMPADGGRVDALVDALRWASAAAFDPAPPKTPATGRIVVSGAKGKGLADLAWGPLAPEPGGAEAVWVTTPARPGVVFRIPASAFGPIPTHPTDLAPRPSSSPTARGAPSPIPAPGSR